MIVEDHADTRDLYAQYLSAQGFRVEPATDGESGLAAAFKSRPDLIVMDLALPQLDGWEATRRLKQDSRTARIPIVACTAHVLGGAVERALDAGCDAYVVKPCLPEDLLREIRRVLRRFTERLSR